MKDAWEQTYVISAPVNQRKHFLNTKMCSGTSRQNMTIRHILTI